MDLPKRPHDFGYTRVASRWITPAASIDNPENGVG